MDAVCSPPDYRTRSWWSHPEKSCGSTLWGKLSLVTALCPCCTPDLLSLVLTTSAREISQLVLRQQQSQTMQPESKGTLRVRQKFTIHVCFSLFRTRMGHTLLQLNEREYKQGWGGDAHWPASFEPTDTVSSEHLGLASADGLDIYEHDWHVNLCELEQKRHQEIKSQVPGYKLITCGGRGQMEFPPRSSMAITQWPGAAGWVFSLYFLSFFFGISDSA